jgi:two-component system, chemotaxis family, CheB/CheR fusion protein
MNDLEIVITETKAQIIIKKELPVIEASPIQIRQLFQNLLSNSLKFVKADVIPKIEITYKRTSGREIDENLSDEEYYIFTIRDNGIGFNPDFKDKIFTIFQRLHSNDVFDGTGIGLAICKKIVDKHRGFIFAESVLNEGALFNIILPVYQATH